MLKRKKRTERKKERKKEHNRDRRREEKELSRGEIDVKMDKVGKGMMIVQELRKVDVGEEQCDQIGRFLKVLGDEFSYKSGPKT